MTLHQRRRAAGLLLVALLGIIVAAAWPRLHKAVRQITLPLHYASIIRQQAHEKRLDPALVAAVIYAETKFNPRTSSAGAEGLMQILPATALFLARRSRAQTFTTTDLATPQVNISYGSYYLRYLLDRYGGNETLALASYNAGEANVDRWRARAHGGALAIADIPFAETRAYVAKVEQAQRDYRSSYAADLGL